MPSTVNTTAPFPEELIANMVFVALQKDLVLQVQIQVQAGLADIRTGLEALVASMSSMQSGLEVLAACVADMEQIGHDVGPRPNISPSEKYDGVFKPLIDQFVCQVEVAAKLGQPPEDSVGPVVPDGLGAGLVMHHHNGVGQQGVESKMVPVGGLADGF
ncbi:hypothetical protein C0993_000427 [Termitomyces sp. T159_Od127]|nr:hypothetical protein C0993_000427 [Termitomyces sp. T159_Od127]